MREGSGSLAAEVQTSLALGICRRWPSRSEREPPATDSASRAPGTVPSRRGWRAGAAAHQTLKTRRLPSAFLMIFVAEVT